MIEKKDPHQKIIPVDFDDTDDIIDLTDEITLKPKEDDEIIDLQGAGTTFLKAPADIPGQKDDIIDLDGTPETESPAEGAMIALGEGVADDKSTLEEDDIIASAIVASFGAGDDDLTDDMTKVTDDADTNSEEDNDIFAMDADPHEGPDLLAFDDEETLKFGGIAELPDLTDEMEFEFDDEDGENGFFAADDQVAEDSDDIIARAVEKSLAPDKATTRIHPAMEPEFEVLSIEDFDDSTDEDEDDIIEITEFDEHFPNGDTKKLERAGVLDASDSDEDDFLELIEVEENDSAEDEEVIKFSNAEGQVNEDEIDNFFSETLEDEPAFKNEEIEPVEETSTLSTDMATAALADEDDEFNFSFNSSEISQQVDRLDTFISDDLASEPEVASLPEKPPAERETVDQDQPAVEDTTESLPVTPDQIESMLERVIKDKLGGKIENIIYEVIEKAVSKEIIRLKEALLGNSGPGDNN